MAQLWVIRHGQASLFSTDYDVLSPKGEAQASNLGKHIAASGIAIDCAFTGPAKRQRDTASLCRAAAGEAWEPAVQIEGLNEHDAFGMLAKVVPKLSSDPEIETLQGAIAAASSPQQRSGSFQRLFEAVMKRWLRDEIDPADAQPWGEFRARVLTGLETLRAAPASAKRIAAFTSVGPLAVLLQQALGTPDLASFQVAWRIRNASITRFEFSRRSASGPLTLDGFNTLPHLPDPASWTFR
ncbi:MAG: histidine phosphatase family protein [Nannocystaceae bacterium]|nr:histidine phosphatase family protein [Nannocystaceae bacterium]